MAQKPAVAQTNGVWSATAGGSWPTGSNWTSSQVATGVIGSANFTSAITGIQAVTLDGDRTVGFMRFTSGGGGNIFSLQMGMSGTLTLQTSSGSPSIDVQSGRSGIIGLALAGSQGFTKVGAGTLEFATPNAFGAAGVGNETVVSGNGAARVRIGGTASTSESFIISGTGVSNTVAINFGSSQGGVNTTGTITSQITLSADAQIGAAGSSFGTLDRLGAGNAVDNAGFRLSFTGAGAFVHNGSGTVLLAAANTFSGSTAITGNGTIRLGTGGSGGSLSTSSAISLAAAASTFVVDQSDTVTQGVDFSGAAITPSVGGSGIGNFTQAGSGTTILTAANAYTVATTVDAGTLLINGNQSAANGAVTVAAGATLGGSGTTGRALSLSFGNGSAFANGTNFDLFIVTGTPSGNFASVTSTGDLNVAVPEPSTFMLLSGLAVGGFLARRRRTVRAK